MKPYEQDVSRVRAMYLMSAASANSRILELCFGSQPLLDRNSSTAITCFLRRYPSSIAPLKPAMRGFACIADYRRDLPFAAESFDLVFIHDGLDRLIRADPSLRSRSAVVDMLNRIGHVLAIGGVFAASVANHTFASRWKRYMFSSKVDKTQGEGTIFSIRSCRDILAECKFSSVQIFNVVPSCNSPLRLINTDADLSRLAFRRELEGIQPKLTWPGYVARRMLVELGLNRYFETSLLFWGEKR